MNKRLVLNLFKYALAIGLLAFVIVRNWDAGNPHGLQHVWQKHFVDGEPIQYQFFALAFCFCLGSVLLTLIRWYVLVRAQDLPFTLLNAIRLGLIGIFFNTFLPGSVGGDIVKAAFIAREQTSRRTTAVATVIIDRAIALWGLVCFVAMCGCIFWLNGSLEKPAAVNIVRIAWAIVGASLVGWMVLGILPEHRAERFAGRLGRLPKVGHAASEFWQAIWMYRQRKLSIAVALLLSWVGHVGFVLTFYFSALTLWDPSAGAIPTASEHFLIIPIGMVIEAAPLFPGGAGVGELGYGGLYALLDYTSANGVLMSLVKRVIAWIVGLFGAVVYLRMKPALQPTSDIINEPAAPAPEPARELAPCAVD